MPPPNLHLLISVLSFSLYPSPPPPSYTFYLSPHFLSCLPPLRWRVPFLSVPSALINERVVYPPQTPSQTPRSRRTSPWWPPWGPRRTPSSSCCPCTTSRGCSSWAWKWAAPPCSCTRTTSDAPRRRTTPRSRKSIWPTESEDDGPAVGLRSLVDFYRR